MPDLYELPIIESAEEIDGEIFTVREPDFAGAVPTAWGQVENLGDTMILYVEAPPEELAKLGGFRHG